MGYIKIVTNFLLGFLIALTAFLFGLKIITSMWGALLGLVINITASAYFLKKHKSNKTLKMLSYGILSACVILVIAYFSLSAMILALFNGVAS
jgi:hypothetical protein